MYASSSTLRRNAWEQAFCLYTIWLKPDVLQLLIGDETTKTISNSLLCTGGRKGIENAKWVLGLKMKWCEPFRSSVNATEC